MNFAARARQQRPGLAPLLIAASAEFNEVDEARARVQLDSDAAHIWKATDGAGGNGTEAILELIRRRNYRPSRKLTPEDAMLDSVLERGVGYPGMISAICAEAGIRAGLDVSCVSSPGNDLLLLIRHPDGSAEIVDPCGKVEEIGSAPRRRCSHEVTFIVLSELSRLFCLTGDIPAAMKAAQMRAELPLGASARERIAFELGALRAMLN